jgi:hypothetical protein
MRSSPAILAKADPRPISCHLERREPHAAAAPLVCQR